ncbi:MAG: hypothetical protein Q8742_02175 [Candidatus Phytoplasma australasiaticum]|nr:hypothetical protein [Candidatus Phytoplasma australasiaticum]
MFSKSSKLFSQLFFSLLISSCSLFDKSDGNKVGLIGSKKI